MTYLEAILLGIVQGLTEFLPVSSSGHLALVQALLGFKNLDRLVLFDLICHLGTLLAIFVVFAGAIRDLLLRNQWRFWQVVVGTLPLFPLVLLIKPIKSLFDRTELLGFFFLCTAFILYAGMRWGKPRSEASLQQSRWRDALGIGLFQAVALMPGISRSGSTISGARLLGWTPQEAVTFSFLLAIPAILGSVALELLQIWKSSEPVPPISVASYGWGFLFSFLCGWVSLIILKRLVAKPQFIYFVWYCLAIGIFAIVYFNG